MRGTVGLVLPRYRVIPGALRGQAIPAVTSNGELRTAGFGSRVTAASEVAGQLCPSGEGRRWQILLVFSQGPLNPAAKIEQRHTKENRQWERERPLSSTSHNSKSGEKVERRKGLEALQVASRQIKSSPNLMVAVPNLIFLHWIQYVLGNVGGREGQYTTLSLLFFAKSSRARHNRLILFSIKCGRLNSAVIKMAALWHIPAVVSGSLLIARIHTHTDATS